MASAPITGVRSVGLLLPGRMTPHAAPPVSHRTGWGGAFTTSHHVRFGVRVVRGEARCCTTGSRRSVRYWKNGHSRNKCIPRCWRSWKIGRVRFRECYGSKAWRVDPVSVLDLYSNLEVGACRSGLTGRKKISYHASWGRLRLRSDSQRFTYDNIWFQDDSTLVGVP